MAMAITRTSSGKTALCVVAALCLAALAPAAEAGFAARPFQAAPPHMLRHGFPPALFRNSFQANPVKANLLRQYHAPASCNRAAQQPADTIPVPDPDPVPEPSPAAPAACAGHADCGDSDSYCRQAVGGPQCSPCTDYRALTCEDWRDSIDGNCAVCRDAPADTQHSPEQQRLLEIQETHEQESIIEAIATPIVGRHGEPRSEPAPREQSGAGRRDYTGMNALLNLAPSASGTPASGDTAAAAPSPPPQAKPRREVRSMVSQSRWRPGSPPVSATHKRVLTTDDTDHVHEERVLHRTVGEQEVTDTLALTHGNPHAEEEEAAATPRRELRRIGSEQELEEFEKHFEAGGCRRAAEARPEAEAEQPDQQEQQQEGQGQDLAQPTQAIGATPSDAADGTTTSTLSASPAPAAEAGRSHGLLRELAEVLQHEGGLDAEGLAILRKALVVDPQQQQQHHHDHQQRQRQG